MTNRGRALGLSVALASGASISSALPQQLNSQQIEIISDTAASICNTVKEAKGRKSDVQMEGDVKAQLGGLVGKLVGASASVNASMSRGEFEGLSRDATAAAMEGDRGCRERLFNKMFDKLTMRPSDMKSEMSKANQLIAAADLGYHFEGGFGFSMDWITCDPLTAFRKREWWYSDPYCHVMDNIFSKQTAEQVNADAARLHIPAYDFKDTLFGEFTYWTLKQYLSDHITELMDPDILEAFEVRSDIRQLGGRRDPHKSQFAVTRQRLINHLKSLNLAKIIIEIPDTDNQSFDGDQILASLHGIIRQSYPTVYMSR